MRGIADLELQKLQLSFQDFMKNMGLDSQLAGPEQDFINMPPKHLVLPRALVGPFFQERAAESFFA